MIVQEFKSDEAAAVESAAIAKEAIEELRPRAAAWFEQHRARAEAAGHSPWQQTVLLFGLAKALFTELVQYQMRLHESPAAVRERAGMRKAD